MAKVRHPPQSNLSSSIRPASKPRASNLGALPQPPRQILGELPGGAAGAGAARGRPFQRVALDFVARRRQAEVIGVAEHHLEIFVLAAAMEPEPEAEAIGEG